MSRFLSAFVSFVLVFAGAFAHAEKWVITTLEWPPFTCEKCPDQGAGAKALKDTMKSVGVDVEFVFLPWSRAINDAKTDKYYGVYPTWPEDVAEPFVKSPAVFSSPLGFIEPVDKKLTIKTLMDLKGKNIGVVQDYGNTVEFQKLAKDGVFKTDAVPSDDFNVKKIAGGRLDAAIIDVNNAKWFLKYDMKDLAAKVSINSFVAENKTLHIAFNPKYGAAANKKMDEAMKKVNSQKLVDEWLNKNMK